MEKVALLKELFMFSRLSAEEIEEFASKMNEKVYQTGTNICEQGTPGASMYIIFSGSCEVVKTSGGAENYIATLSPGDFLGEISLFDYSPRSATVRATEQSTMMEITKEDFDAVVLEKPEIGTKILYSMMEEMARRLRKKIEDAFLL